MKKTFKFEIDNLITINVNAETKEEARMFLVDNPDYYKDEIMSDVYISNGEEVKD